MSLNGYLDDNKRGDIAYTIEEYLTDHLSKVSVDDLIKFADLNEYPEHDIVCAMEHELDNMTVKIQNSIDEGEYSE